MPYTYASQFRSMAVEQVRSGKRVAEVAATLEITQATVFRRVRQDRIDRVEIAGTPTAESSELRAARRRIAELESELVTVKRASALFTERSVVRQKELCGKVEPWRLREVEEGAPTSPVPLRREEVDDLDWPMFLPGAERIC